ncbi:MAG: succinylglutamate desuccinylase/aspartoacylase family protein [bacterium]|nr:succinylglutamate desuccinylase/aspartoacylase family protein [bacterium]
MPICVCRGEEPGPVCFISAAVHGDEIIGTEIIKRLIRETRFKILRGSLIYIPIVNVFGFNNRSRYLPDRRDLNRSFPGSSKGSLSSRLANLFLEQIIKQSHYGIDLHSAAVHRANLPQIRACLNNPKTKIFAEAFGAPVAINAELRDGSIRNAADDIGVTMLLFEGGEALRHDDKTIKSALKGVANCLISLRMIKPLKTETKSTKFFIANSTYWVRAPQSGTIRVFKRIGKVLQKGDKLAVISDAFGGNRKTIYAQTSGIIIGENRLPLVNQGDALFNVACYNEQELENLFEEYADYSVTMNDGE